MACDTTWDAVMDKIRDAMNKDVPVQAIDLSSDGIPRYGCPICQEWWYDEPNYCCNCGQKIRYK